LSVALASYGKAALGAFLALIAVVVLIFTYSKILSNIRKTYQRLDRLKRRDSSSEHYAIENNEFAQISEVLNDVGNLLSHLLETRRVRDEEFITILNAITSPIFIVNDEGKIIVANLAADKIMRKPVQSAGPIFYYEAIRSNELNSFIGNALKNKLKQSTVFITDDFFYEITSFPFSSKEGEFALIYADDITEKERIRIIQKDFTESFSHELRTPLSIISGIVEIIENEELVKENGIRFLKPLRENVERMNEIASKTAILLEVDSFEGKMDEAVNLTVIAKDVISKYAPLAKSKGLDFKSELEKDVYTEGNSILLIEMLSNLVENAIKYTDKGFIKIAVKSDEFATVTIFDTGCGIDEKFINKIFEPFSREDFSRRRESGGLGLGLAIANRVAKLHHGTITVESEKDKFSKFTVNLPLLRKVNNKLT